MGVLAVLLGAVLVLLAGSSASALPSAPTAPTIPGIPDCKDAPTPQIPGDGLPGFLDPAPAKPAAPADPFATPKTTSVYDQYGYAGLTWNTYDLGCAGSLGDPTATADTMIGNFGLSFAVWGVAASNGIHDRVADPQSYMGPLDQVVASVTARVKDAIWGPWGGAALLGVVALLLWYSAAGRLSDVTRAAAWAVLVLMILAGVTSYPTRVSGFFDQAITSSIGQIDQATAGIAEPAPGSDPARAQGGLLVDHVLYDAWLRGELGSSDSAAAAKWGPTLFKASAFTYDEERQAQDPARAQQLIDEKAQTFKDTAAQIQEQDPSAYANLQGKAGNRMGVGLVGALGMLFTVLFRLVADAFLFAGLVLLRFLVMLFPAVAVLGIMAPMSSIVHRVANMAGAAVVNVVAFAAGSAVHIAVISAILSQSAGLGMGVLTLLMCLVVSVVAFVLLFPLLSLTNIVGLSSGHRGVSALKRVGRLATQYAVTRRATSDGLADEEQHQRVREPAETVTGPHRQPAGTGRPMALALGSSLPVQGDAFARPYVSREETPPLRGAQVVTGEVVADGGAVPSTVGARNVQDDKRHLYLPASSTTLRQALSGSAESSSGLDTSTRAGEAPDRPSPSDGDASGSAASGGTPVVRLGERPATVVKGPVLPPDAEPVDQPVHDNHWRLDDHGMRPVFFDPSTKREFVADGQGHTVESER